MDVRNLFFNSLCNVFYQPEGGGTRCHCYAAVFFESIAVGNFQDRFVKFTFQQSPKTDTVFKLGKLAVAAVFRHRKIGAEIELIGGKSYIHIIITHKLRIVTINSRNYV